MKPLSIKTELDESTEVQCWGALSHVLICLTMLPTAALRGRGGKRGMRRLGGGGMKHLVYIRNMNQNMWAEHSPADN